MESEDKNPTKKTYKSPDLIFYGDIHEITRTNDDAGMDDGGMGMTDKT